VLVAEAPGHAQVSDHVAGAPGEAASSFGLNIVMAGQSGTGPQAGHRVGTLGDSVNTYARLASVPRDMAS